MRTSAEIKACLEFFTIGNRTVLGLAPLETVRIEQTIKVLGWVLGEEAIIDPPKKEKSNVTSGT